MLTIRVFFRKEFIPLLLVKLIKEGDQKIEEISFDNNLKELIIKIKMKKVNFFSMKIKCLIFFQDSIFLDQI